MTESYRERLQKLISTTSLERRIRDDLFETFKSNGIPKYDGHFFNIFPRTRNLLSRQISTAKSTNQLDLFAKRAKYLSM